MGDYLLLCLFKVAVTRKMNEYKDEILARIDEKFNSLETNILADLKDQIKNELAGVLKKEFRKKEEQEQAISVLQEHVHYQNQANEVKRENEEHEQYDRRLRVTNDGVPLVENVTSDEGLDKIKSLMEGVQNVLLERGGKLEKGG